MIQEDADVRKSRQQADQFRNAGGRHLDADRNVMPLRVFPDRKRSFVVQPVGLTRHRRAGREDAQSAQAGIYPALHLDSRCRRPACRWKTRRRNGPVRADGVGYISVVVAVGGGGLHDHRMRDAGRIHCRQQRFVVGRAVSGPVRLMSPDRRQRIADLVGEIA